MGYTSGDVRMSKRKENNVADLRFELEEEATRKRIFATLISSLPHDIERAKVGVVVGDNSIRMEQQLSNVAEIEAALGLTVAGDYAKEHTLAIYRILAEAEAKAHGCPLEEAHFHEVGKGMTVREILGICTAFELLARAGGQRHRRVLARYAEHPRPGHRGHHRGLRHPRGGNPPRRRAVHPHFRRHPGSLRGQLFLDSPCQQ